MPHARILHEVPVKATPASIYAALTEADSLAKWWIPDTRGVSRIGGILEFRIGDMRQRIEVKGLQRDRQVRWHVPDDDNSDWAGTNIEFTLLPCVDSCKLRFRHDDLHPRLEKLPYYSMSWAVFLLSLKELVETGTGFPFPNRWIHQ